MSRAGRAAWCAIRSYLNVTAFGEESLGIIEAAIAEACQVKEDLADIINVTIEELVRQRHDPPAFSTLCRLAYRGRAQANNLIYKKIAGSLSRKDRALLNRLFRAEEEIHQSPWQIVKSGSKRLTLKNFRQRIEFFQWLDRYSTGAIALDGIADMKIKQFAAEGKSLKAREMARLKAAKRYSLAVSLIAVKKAAALDDLRVPRTFARKCTLRNLESHHLFIQHIFTIPPDGKYHGVLTDISAGGLFIRTVHIPVVGQAVTLKFTLFSFDEIITVSGTVTRTQENGFAAKFDEPIEMLAHEEDDFPSIVSECDR